LPNSPEQFRRNSNAEFYPQFSVFNGQALTCHNIPDSDRFVGTTTQKLTRLDDLIGVGHARTVDSSLVLIESYTLVRHSSILKEISMLHMSIAVNNPHHVADVLAEIMQGNVIPFPLSQFPSV
jgi:hypothetical protein